MKKIIATIVAFAPVIASAQIVNADSLVVKLTNLGNTFIGVLIAFAVIYIVYNIVRFIVKSDSPEERSTIGKAILWSIVGLFVMLSIWGLVRILTGTFRTDTTAPTNQFPRVIPPPLSGN